MTPTDLTGLRDKAEAARDAIAAWKAALTSHPTTELNSFRREVTPEVVLQLIAEVETARAENERLREALKPFAEAVESLADDTQDHHSLWEDPAALCISAGELRAARQALNTESGDG